MNRLSLCGLIFVLYTAVILLAADPLHSASGKHLVRYNIPT